MCERNHCILQHKIATIFPDLFKYAETGVLFMDRVVNNLYGIKTANLEAGAMELTKDNVMRYPTNIGITGHAIKTKEVQKNTEGYRNRKFAPEVDNYNNNFTVQNLVIGPMVDTTGKVRGVVQLLNKKGKGIPDEDIEELASLLPCLGEIVRTADDCFELEKLQCALQHSLVSVNNAVFDKNTELSKSNGVPLTQLVRQLQNMVEDLISSRKKFAFQGDAKITKEILRGL